MNVILFKLKMHINPKMRGCKNDSVYTFKNRRNIAVKESSLGLAPPASMAFLEMPPIRYFSKMTKFSLYLFLSYFGVSVFP